MQRRSRRRLNHLGRHRNPTLLPHVLLHKQIEGDHQGDLQNRRHGVHAEDLTYNGPIGPIKEDKVAAGEASALRLYCKFRAPCD